MALAAGIALLACGAGVPVPAVVSSSPPRSESAVRSEPGAAPRQAPSAVPPSVAAPVLLSARDLDAMVARLWDDAGVTPAAPADDAEFLRRVMLDVAGRVPTLAEAEGFLAAGGSDKRARLVDGALASADYAEHWADICVDLFIGRQFRKPRLQKRLDPRAYFVTAFRENRPFDRIAREMLTFTGEIQPNGPGVFLASYLKGGGAETAAAVTARLFMGVQLSCAQCHDHPYDARYKQEDFYGLVAYFAGTKSRAQKRPGDDGGAAPDAGTNAAAPMVAARPARSNDLDRIYSIADSNDGQGRGRKARFRKVGALEETAVAPRFFGRDVAPLPGETPRDALARAVVDSDLFAKTMVGRTWARLFGRGIVEPWDDLGGEGDPRHTPLLTRLAEDFRAGGFDVRRLVRMLVLSRAYGLTSRVAPVDAGDTANAAPPDVDPTSVFARASVRRLTPEQLFRSLLVATGADQMERKGAEDMDKKTERLMREALFVFGDDEMAEVDTFNGNIPQALLMFNGEIVNAGAQARAGGTLAAILDRSSEPATRLRSMFMAAYARPPSPAERERFLPTLSTLSTLPPGGGAARAAYEDLFFALVTSSEMQTIH
ncbi:MAG: DUF1549 and DUF1553 domain-containing protein [Pseudomonadota bacterium]